MSATTLDPAEIAKFAAMAEAWWDPKGDFAPLHRMNPARLGFLREAIGAHFGRGAGRRPFEGLTMIDVGCGGGLVTEPMARLGATVTGLDGAEESVKAAQAHAIEGGLAIDYRQGTAEDLAASGAAFDVVLALEIIEHVADMYAFCEAAVALAKPNGLVIFSTINRTAKARALAITAAERILRWVPHGTHDFEKLVKPDELAAALLPLVADAPVGLSFNPLTGAWKTSEDVSMNYFLTVTKPAV
ncbi:MAG: bifunctional 2-polyprenyl-6-hydroxyphenol methylase/3-demethylubiquinol 3-O-methyltransferase UbiG [Hyphomonadaceae bacterium]|nr:MAG: 2-polyprenyl-6-hydroxyphenyl methylase / 3-demethylubiquinone-9 3-methyltransferase [Caulobacteraceae bacterium]MBT9447405.1 bifunctional 2-polyprenyl-6-hydroxyphenol methylase/3-demethylubiquinol 3-O-methyltransferase UbiG [Hyphomonadaceae bacterium]TPW07473.1 MAG: 2-polyprenyl-6-hydroxyphenyl methylase / 3-demethylubiquinone-9 3-methyltransferase [Alphaproteobacteria bacterium]